VDNIGDLIVELANEGIDRVTASINYSLAGSEIENLALSGTANLTGTGNAYNNFLTGNAGANTLYGGEGNDSLNGGEGADSLIGGLGDDSYTVDNIGDLIVELANEGIDRVTASINYSLAGSEIENLALSVTANLTGTGNAYNNFLTGNAGANTLYGGEGNDSLNGGEGADSLIGGLGNDSYAVDNIGDLIVELANEGIDRVTASINYSLAGSEIENLTLIGTANLTGTGNAYNNFLTGNAGANTLAGGDGNDTLSGGEGADSLIGGLGNDTYIVDNAGDVIDESVASGNDTVTSSISWTLGINVENLVLTGFANLVGVGNDLDNRIQANGGNCTLNGGLGRDTLVGGAGADSFLFATAPVYGVGTADGISSFNAAAGDRIMVDRLAFGIGAASVSLISVDAAGLANGLRTSNLFVYNTSAGELFYNENGSATGFGSGGIFAVFAGRPDLPSSALTLQ
jgi:Ca2+-binding RTX toxin-like protein